MKSPSFIAILLSTLMVISIGAKVNDSPYFKTPKGYSFISPGQYQSKVGTVTMQAYFMSSCEITNGQYKLFLDDLKKQTDTTDYSIAKIKADNWKTLKVFDGSEYSSWANYPVVNISKEAAILYCQWLTKKLQAEDKNEHTIEVRLPTRNEWEWAAMGGIKDAVYPWNGPYLRNSKGCYLAHFKVLSQPYGPYKVALYSPNGYNLYDMAGNVAEMVSDADLVKGGSWNSLPYELKITEEAPYSVSPMVGFRPVITFITKH